MVEATAVGSFHLRGTGMHAEISSATSRTGRNQYKTLQAAESALKNHRPRSPTQCELERENCHKDLIVAARRHRFERKLVWFLVMAAFVALLCIAASGALHDALSLSAGVLAVLIVLVWVLVDISGYRLTPFGDEELSGLAGMLSETWPLDEQESTLVYQICRRHPDLAATRASWATANPRLTIREMRLLVAVDALRGSKA